MSLERDQCDEDQMKLSIHKKKLKLQELASSSGISMRSYNDFLSLEFS